MESWLLLLWRWIAAPLKSISWLLIWWKICKDFLEIKPLQEFTVAKKDAEILMKRAENVFIRKNREIVSRNTISNKECIHFEQAMKSLMKMFKSKNIFLRRTSTRFAVPSWWKPWNSLHDSIHLTNRSLISTNKSREQWSFPKCNALAFAKHVDYLLNIIAICGCTWAQTIKRQKMRIFSVLGKWQMTIFGD